jgi:gluconokinase
MQQRKHFMPPQLLQSQFNDLEIPAGAFTIDITNDPDTIIEMIMRYLKDF